MTLVQEHKCYPNGEPYIAITMHGLFVCHVQAADGGYRSLGMRKVRPTLQSAVAAAICSDMRRLRRQLVEMQAWLDELDRER